MPPLEVEVAVQVPRRREPGSEALREKDALRSFAAAAMDEEMLELPVVLVFVVVVAAACLDGSGPSRVVGRESEVEDELKMLVAKVGVVAEVGAILSVWQLGGGWEPCRASLLPIEENGGNGRTIEGPPTQQCGSVAQWQRLAN